MRELRIIKTTGEKQKYSPNKLKRSLRRAGASAILAEEIVTSIPLEKIKTSQDIHAYVFNKLRAVCPPIAARYDIKTALLHLGPTGYPFEKFVGEIFRALGYRVRTNQALSGRCVAHEVDVVAENSERKVFMECKYHGQKNLRSNVQTALYVKARFDDVRHTLERDAQTKKIQGLIITNTTFSTDARKYARCVHGLGLIEWRRPRGFSLAELIERTHLHPVSALTTLSRKQKERLMQGGIVLCRDLLVNHDVLYHIGLSKKKIARVMKEAHAVCGLGKPCV